MKYMFIVLLALTFWSCATTRPTPDAFPPDYTGPAIIEGSPWATVVGSGSCHYVYAKVLDKYGNPLPDQAVTATFEYDDEPVAYFYDEEMITDKNGVAEFFAVGIGWPGYNKIIFRSGKASASVYIWTRGYSPFQRG